MKVTYETKLWLFVLAVALGIITLHYPSVNLGLTFGVLIGLSFSTLVSHKQEVTNATV